MEIHHNIIPVREFLIIVDEQLQIRTCFTTLLSEVVKEPIILLNTP